MSAHLPPSRGPRDNLIALATVQGLRFSAALGVSVLLARSLGREGFGDYAFIATVVHVCGFLANAGLHQLLPREVARDPSAAPTLTGAALRATALTALVAAVPVTAYVAATAHGLAAAAAVAAIALALEAMVNIYMAAFEGLRRMRLQLAGVAAGRATVVVGVTLAVVAGVGLPAVFAAQAIGLAVTLAVFARTFHRRVGPLRAERARPVLARAAPFAAFVAFAAVQERVDVLVLEATRGADAVGTYRGATLLLLNVPVLARILATAAYPRLARTHSHAPHALPEATDLIARWLLATGLALAVGGFAVGPALITSVLGHAYVHSGTLFRWGALVLPIVFVRTGLGMVLSATNAESTRARGMAVAAALNLTLNLLVVPRFGAPGAIATTAASEVALLAIYAWTARNALPARAWAQSLARTAPPALALGVLLALPGPLALRVPVGCAAWTAVAVLTGALRRADIIALRNL